MAEVVRVHPLQYRGHRGPRVSVIPAEPAKRMSLRARDSAVASLDQALGLELPRRPKGTAQIGARAALWLGPDEWLVIDQGEGNPLADSERATGLFSGVDISHRNTAILVEGEAAAAVINSGCPLDLSDAAFQVGAATRTLLGKAEIVLWRTGPTAYRVEVWRSFSDYVMTYLSEAASGI